MNQFKIDRNFELHWEWLHGLPLDSEIVLHVVTSVYRTISSSYCEHYTDGIPIIYKCISKFQEELKRDVNTLRVNCEMLSLMVQTGNESSEKIQLNAQTRGFYILLQCMLPSNPFELLKIVFAIWGNWKQLLNSWNT